MRIGPGFATRAGAARGPLGGGSGLPFGRPTAILYSETTGERLYRCGMSGGSPAQVVDLGAGLVLYDVKYDPVSGLAWVLDDDADRLYRVTADTGSSANVREVTGLDSLYGMDVWGGDGEAGGTIFVGGRQGIKKMNADSSASGIADVINDPSYYNVSALSYDWINDWIYFLNWSEGVLGEEAIWRVRPNGTGLERVASWPDLGLYGTYKYGLCVDPVGEYVYASSYYSSSGRILRYPLDGAMGGTAELIASISGLGNFRNMVFDHYNRDFIYMAIEGTSGGVYRIRPDGTDGALVVAQSSCFGVTLEYAAAGETPAAPDPIAEASGAAALFLPGTGLWADSGATDPATAGESVALWRSSIGSVDALNAGAAGTRPTRVASVHNGLDGLRFTRASSQFLSLSTVLGRPLQWTIYTVAAVRSVARDIVATMYGQGSSVDDAVNAAMCLQTNHTNVSFDNGDCVVFFGNGSTSKTVTWFADLFNEIDAFALVTHRKAVNAATEDLWKNGAPLTKTQLFAETVTPGTTPQEYALGRRGAHSNGVEHYWDGVMLLHFVCTSAHTTAERQDIEAAIAEMCGITLAA